MHCLYYRAGICTDTAVNRFTFALLKVSVEENLDHAQANQSDDQSFSYYSCPAVMQGLHKMEMRAVSSETQPMHSSPDPNEFETWSSSKADEQVLHKC